MVVGEAPGADEEARGEPFVGASGSELNRMLHEAGIMRSECFVTNVCRERPYNNDISTMIAPSKKAITKEHHLLRDRWVKKPIVDGFAMLQKEISLVKPNIIIALGNTPLWALTGKHGILRMRGSMLHADNYFPGNPQVIPTLHPALILRQWEFRATTVQDLRRAAKYRITRYPGVNWDFSIRPSFEMVVGTMQFLLNQLVKGPTKLSFDVETRNGHMTCAGIAWSKTQAICVPLTTIARPEGYWNLEQETEIVWYFYKVLTHKNAQVIGQNILYDSQHTYRHWFFVPRIHQDTMISQHVCFAGLRKSLDFQASLYCENYVQWKPDKSVWKEGG